MASTMMVSQMQDDVLFQSPRGGVVHIAQPTKVNIKKPKKPAGENTGRWTKEEHNTFLEGLRIHGKEWKKIANMIATRSVVQIRTHAQKYFQKLAKSHESEGKEIPEDLISTATNPKHYTKTKSTLMTSRCGKEMDIPIDTASVDDDCTDSTVSSDSKHKKSPKRRRDTEEESLVSTQRLTINVGGTQSTTTDENKARISRDADDFKWLVSGLGKLPDASPTSVADIGFYRTFGGADGIDDDMFHLDNHDEEAKDLHEMKKNDDIDMMSDELSNLCDDESIKEWINSDDIDAETDLDLLSCDDEISRGLEAQPDLAEIGPLTTFVFGEDVAPPCTKRNKSE